MQGLKSSQATSRCKMSRHVRSMYGSSKLATSFVDPFLWVFKGYTTLLFMLK